MTGHVELVGLVKTFPQSVARALDDVTLDLRPGELVAVIGPSGCGKTTLLRTIAGLERPDAGRVRIDAHDVTATSAAQRPVAMVFQSDTLFPDLTVRANVGFGLRSRRSGPPASHIDVEEAVEVMMLRLGILGLADRYPDELSGGQLRRVALARALVLRPAVLLLDEPLAALDGSLRQQLAALIRINQRRFGLTTLYVTHDQDDALSMADRVLVLRDGAVEQLGTSHEVYNRPRTIFVASFVGRANLVHCAVVSIDPDRGTAVTTLLGDTVELLAHPDLAVGPAIAVLRPEALQVTPSSAGPVWADPVGDSGQVVQVAYYGARLDYVVETAEGLLTVAGDPGREPLPVGGAVRIRIDPSRGWLLQDL
ncbi:MAG TPA: ABC transporter ATP-binding protein [Propionibacteriaceae bacterium]|nr:ABC transporter ATP-binding protein [Propionibacteriaceae bacterium]